MGTRPKNAEKTEFHGAFAVECQKKSAESKRKRKELRQAFEILLSSKVTMEDGKKLSGVEALAWTVFQNALAGDLKAFELIRDTVGEKPVERMEVSTISQKTREEVERTVMEALSETLPE